MDFEITKKIDVDFYNSKLIYVNAKQNDSTRYILITCYNQGAIIKLNPATNNAYLRGKKPDDYGIFNSCSINEEGKILIELTQQSMCTSGIMIADLVVYESPNTVISTMPFYINIVPTALDNSEIESSYEFKALNDMMVSALMEYDSVILQCKVYHDSIQDSAHLARSYAIGDTNTRDDEETDNAKYYCEIAQQLAGNLHAASVSEVQSYLNIN